MTDEAETEYEFETEFRVRFRDIDAMGHVNNAVYATYLEQARADYFREVVGESLSEVGSVLASIAIEFRAPVEGDDVVTVALTIPELGTASIPMHYEIRREDGTVAATAETVQVVYDREAGESKPIPDAWREAIESA
ncbi:acyl-CoA thioesterase [Salinirubellus salinus]|jgi:acyl-CoA thioester hydrolase|uniref:Acyl-CoA thioesterase n=1 Tax=Salinirubellus salinus TaxID=1364945 RepID=A0A9E7UAK3_9EURY|nr:thioesterase family protein [Salinirubellus salinus]UWM54348.1 acyl-CoA thioesterase [Salinirubellus salinus]